MARPERIGGRADGAAVVLRGGRVYVGSDGRLGGPGRPRARFAEAIALGDGTVLTTGTAEEVARHVTATTEVVDLRGRTVVPGLIDSHLHLVRAGLTWTEEVRWFEVPTLERALSLLGESASRLPAGTWLRVVGGWHPGQFAERRGPIAGELTRLFPDHPVYVQLLYEEAVLNAAGLRACGITAGVDDPPNGTFLRDPATGEPTGVVRGVGAFTHCLARMPTPRPADQVTGTRQALATLNAYGITGAADPGGIGVGPDAYGALFEIWRADELPVRIRLYLGSHTRGREHGELAGWLDHVQPGFGDPWLRYLGLGEIAMFGCHDLEGLTRFTVDEAAKRDLEAVLREAARRRWPVHLHAVLDSTADAILDVWERVAADLPIRDLRWSLAHAEPVSARNLDRIAALGAGIAVQDRLVYRAADSARAWGEATVRCAPPLREIARRGIPLGGGTDATRVSSPNPWVSLWWLVTGKTVDGGPRRVAGQCLDRASALDAYSAGSAWFSFEDHVRGSLRPGMAADLAVLSDDYFTVPEDEIPAIRSVLTLVDGRAVHAEDAFAGLA